MHQGLCRSSAYRERRLRCLLGALVICALLVQLPSRASATNLSITRFDPTPANDGLFGVNSPQIGPFKLSARLTLDWAHNPLVFYADNATTISVVQNQVFANLGVAVALWDRLSFSVDLPVALVQTGPSPTFEMVTFTSPRGVHIADLRLGARVRLMTAFSGLLQISAGGFIWLPLGSSSSAGGAYASDAFVRGKLELLVGGQHDRFVWSIVAAADLRRAQRYLDVSQASMLRLSAGLGVKLLANRQLQVGPEAIAAITLPHVSRYNTNIELLAGVRYFFANGVQIGTAAGPGLTSGIGTPDFRVVASVGYTFGFEQEPPQTIAPQLSASQPATMAASAPVESASSEPAIVSSAPAASLPIEPATQPMPEPAPGPIIRLDRVKFANNSDRMLKSSNAVLQDALGVLAGLPSHLRFRVEGHTDDVGSAKHNRELSLRRAHAVVRWFVEHGLAENRFDERGLGPDVPIASNRNSIGRRQNRRVEIHLAERQ